MQTPYDSFNARNLTPEAVAETFVPHPLFDKLLSNDHIILMGPRGSGKTTMLKMMTPRALDAWKSPEAKRIRSELAFVAVYIPTDIHWHNQLQYYQDKLAKFPELASAISRAAVTTNVLNAACIGMSDKLQFILKDQYSMQKEADLCEMLIKAWRLPRCIPCLSAILLALQSRLNDIVIESQKLIYTNDSDSMIPNLPDSFFVDYHSAVVIAFKAFDHIFLDQSRRRWALCFDELELAPEWLQTRLLTEVRSTDEILVFKLSTSPIPAVESTSQASPRNDFSTIRLWAHAKQDFRPFCAKLAKSILERNPIVNSDPVELFGLSPIAGNIRRQGSNSKEYELGSQTWEILQVEAKNDVSLNALLIKKGINLSNPTAPDQESRDQVLRKIKPTVLLRHAFRVTSSTGHTRRRSRKQSTIYSGAEAIYTMSDGNPRWLIGIINDMLSVAPKANDGRINTISDHVQARVLYDVSQQYCAFLRALTDSSSIKEGENIKLYSFLETISQFFFDKIIEGDFPLDPVGSFKIDAAVPIGLVKILRTAAYYGGVIFVDPQDHAFDSKLLGKRFRLSFMLSPQWKLPLRLYSAVALSKCLHSLLNPKRKSPKTIQRRILDQQNLEFE